MRFQMWGDGAMASSAEDMTEFTPIRGVTLLSHGSDRFAARQYERIGHMRYTLPRYIGPSRSAHIHTQESDMGLLDSIVGQVSGALAGAAPGAGDVHPGLM